MVLDTKTVLQYCIQFQSFSLIFIQLRNEEIDVDLFKNVLPPFDFLALQLLALRPN